MDGRRLADRLAYGAGRVAARVGYVCDAYRPAGTQPPLDPAARFLRLPVALVLPGGAVTAPSPFGVPFRQAWADWSYLRVGDYLAGPEGAMFVAAIEPPKPMLVVMTNTVISLMRFGAGLAPGANVYPAAHAAVLAREFPAAVMAGGTAERSRDGLADDARLPGFVAMLPEIAGVLPRVGDAVADAEGTRMIVSGVQRVMGCWRLSLWQAAA